MYTSLIAVVFLSLYLKGFLVVLRCALHTVLFVFVNADFLHILFWSQVLIDSPRSEQQNILQKF